MHLSMYKQLVAFTYVANALERGGDDDVHILRLLLAKIDTEQTIVRVKV